MQINQLLTPYNFSPGTIDRIRYIVIHYVGATGGAHANCLYYAGQYAGASAHYFVGFDGEIWQSVEDKNIAWHCGSKSGYCHPECRNANSIGIELCVRSKGSRLDTSHDWYFEDATVTAAIALTKELMKKYNISPDHVIRHYDVTGKICPNPFVYNHTKHTWNQFKSALTSGSPGTLPIQAGQDGLHVSVSGVLNIRNSPAAGAIIGTLKNGQTVYPDRKIFVNGTAWYYLPGENGWISSKYLDGGWICETGIASPRKWWYIHKGYTFTSGGIEVIDGNAYAFNREGYLIENTELTFQADPNGVLSMIERI